MDKMFVLEGFQLEQLITELKGNGVGTKPYKLRIGIDGDRVKFKVNERMWSPPMGEIQGEY